MRRFMGRNIAPKIQLAENGAHGSSDSPQIELRDCDPVRPLLSRYLDRDLPARAATDVAAHLGTCASCRHEYEVLTTLREALHATVTATPAGSEAARDRIFTQLERASRVAQASRATQNASVLRGGRPVFAALPTVVAAGMVIAGGLLFHTFAPSVPSDSAESGYFGSPSAASAAAVALPSPERMSALFDLHDARAAQAAAAPDNNEAPADTAAPATENKDTLPDGLSDVPEAL